LKNNKIAIKNIIIMSLYSIAEELESSRQMIEGALASPEIMKVLAGLGMDKKEILRGKSLFLKMSGQQDTREAEQNNQKEATEALYTAQAEAHSLYMKHVKYARLAVPAKSKAWNNMKLSGNRRKDLTGWLMQTRAFYNYAPAVADALAQSGISGEELAQAQAMVEAVAAARIQQNLGKSKKQRAKVQRDKDREALQQWTRKFVKAARFAFDEDKQQLEALGIVVASA
jgi:hypothetical protein